MNKTTNPTIQNETKPIFPGAYTTFDKLDKEKHLAISKKGGQSRSPKKVHASTKTIIHNNPVIQRQLTPRKAHLIYLLNENDFPGLIKSLFTLILSEATDVEEYLKILQQLMKIPEMAKIMRENQTAAQTDAISIMIKLLKKHNREDILAELHDELQRGGVHGTTNTTTDYRDTTVSTMRPNARQTESQSGIVEGEVDQAGTDTIVPELQPEADIPNQYSGSYYTPPGE